VEPAIEERVEVEIEVLHVDGRDVSVVLSGAPDVVYPGELIVDWKTAAKMWNPTKIQGEIQRIAYPYLTGQDVPFTYWVYDRSSMMWGAITAQAPSKPELRAFLGQAKSAARALIHEAFTYSPAGQAFTSVRGWHCSPKYCDVWAVCDARHLIADDKAGLPVPTIREKFNL